MTLVEIVCAEYKERQTRCREDVVDEWAKQTTFTKEV